MARRNVLVRLVTPPLESLSPELPRGQKIARLLDIARSAKGRFRPVLESLRRIDPELCYDLKDDLFPIVYVNTTDPGVAALKESPLVETVEDAWRASIR
jgi:hypothetical protein